MATTTATCQRQVCALAEDGQREMRDCTREAGHDGVCRHALPTDPIDFEEDEDYARRVQLGLRPIAYKQGDKHPDTSPCPLWCAHAEQETPHRVQRKIPLSAHHTSHPLTTVASYYRGSSDLTDYLQTAHWRTTMVCRSQGDAEIRIDLEGNSESGDWKVTNQMSLSIDDAREIITVLSYFVAQNDAEISLRGSEAERNAFELGRDYERGQVQ